LAASSGLWYGSTITYVINRTRSVTAAQKASADVWSSDSWPPELSHLYDGAGVR